MMLCIIAVWVSRDVFNVANYLLKLSYPLSLPVSLCSHQSCKKSNTLACKKSNTAVVVCCFNTPVAVCCLDC
ncbi:hypothetical protein LINPERPRIM_LOCUS22219 [Linum perenne]